VREVAQRLTSGGTTTRVKLERLFAYVRDDIKFQFPRAGDQVKASDTIRTGHGQCNTKSTLFLALCKAAGIPARIHFSLISKEIQHGLFTGLAYWLMPPKLSHSWIEVEVDGRWRRIDAYINDPRFQQGAIAELECRGWRTGFSVALPAVGEPAAGLDVDDEKYVQMAAVTDDHGTYDDPAEYYAGSCYRNRPGRLKLWLYRLMIGGINKRVGLIRQGDSKPPRSRR
jgi:Transglutaminase-like superfamily